VDAFAEVRFGQERSHGLYTEHRAQGVNKLVILLEFQARPENRQRPVNRAPSKLSGLPASPPATIP
jgi:hypothetical protein